MHFQLTITYTKETYYVCSYNGKFEIKCTGKFVLTHLH